MRRAAVQALRTVRSKPFRKVLTQRAIPISSLARHTNTRPIAWPSRKHASTQIVQSSMYLRNFSVAAFVSVLASGYWFYQRDHSSDSKAFTTSPNVSPFLATPQTSTLAAAADQPTSPIHTSLPTASVQPATGPAEQITIQEGQFYVSELSQDQSLGKQTEEQKYQMGPLSPDQATQKLRQTERSYLIGRDNGVARYDLVQMASNNPIEDDHSERIVAVDQTITPLVDGSQNDWMFWGVYDGHSGWTTSAKLRQVLISYVARELHSTYKSALANPGLLLPTPDAVDAAIKRGFLTLDHDIVNTAVDKTLSGRTKLASTEILAPALSGSCALLSFYDSRTKLFRVACTGDSRAVLGRKGTTGKWTATALSEDQTGGTPSEMERLRFEHPGEDYVVHRGRILGQLEPSRAFGDASYKWTRDVQDKVKKFFFGRTPNPLLKSPPYVTAEPVITTTKVEPEKGDFVVLATDGLWEMLTNEEVVGLVGRWLEEKQGSKSVQGSWTSSFWKGPDDKSLPVEKEAQETGLNEKEGQRTPIRQQQYDIKSKDDRFVVEDENVATHLVRNALGGRDRDLVCALLSLISPNSRRYR